MNPSRDDALWGRVNVWLAKRTLKECFIEVFELVDALADALEIAETSIKNKARARKSLALIARARSITGRV